MSIYLKNISNQLVVLTVIVLDRFSFFSFFFKTHVCEREIEWCVGVRVGVGVLEGEGNRVFASRAAVV